MKKPKKKEAKLHFHSLRTYAYPFPVGGPKGWTRSLIIQAQRATSNDWGLNVTDFREETPSCYVYDPSPRPRFVQGNRGGSRVYTRIALQRTLWQQFHKTATLSSNSTSSGSSTTSSVEYRRSLSKEEKLGGPLF
ncbi:hypothetical protein NC652_028314 [Populus alba x Populus x berolinensis]|nr:hypothetical protein NC652_028314 [Populus alba x Populus x berolinensis]